MAYRRTGGLGLPPAGGPALINDVPAIAVPAVFTNSRRVTLLGCATSMLLGCEAGGPDDASISYTWSHWR
jgi:hypothetical protein